MSVSRLFNEPVKCVRCGKVFPAEAKHICVPLWVQGFVKGTFKALSVFAFAMLIGLGLGFGFSWALQLKPVVVGAVITCD